jgi:ABC-2 type transport system permease protein
MLSMKRFGTLIKRELLEHRRSILITPLIMVGVTFLLILISVAWGGVFKINSQSFDVNAFTTLFNKEGGSVLTQVHQGWLLSFFLIFHIAGAVVMLIYALNCLFEERKDRSTLFWRSLPVRDWETVLAKSITLLVIIPVIFMTLTMLLQLLVAALLVVLCWSNGVNASEVVFNTLPLAHAQLWQYCTQLITSLWVLPIFAWFLFCSAYAKQRPFIMAMFPPGILLAVFGAMSAKSFVGSGDTGIAGFIWTHYFLRLRYAFEPGEALSFGRHSISNPLSFEPMLDRLTSTPMLIGIVIGLALLAATAYVRRYREDATV